MGSLFPPALQLDVLATDLEGGGGKLISEANFNCTASIWAHKSVLQQLCHATAAEIRESKLTWQCGRTQMEINLTFSYACCGSCSNRMGNLG